MRTTIIAGLAAAALYTASAEAGERIADVTVGGIQLPEYIGPLEYMGERSGGELAKGARYAYQARGLALDIYVADHADGLPDGLDSPQILSRYAEAGAGTASASAASARELIRSGLAHFGAADAPAAREMVFLDEAGTHYVWLTALHGLLIEARLDVEAGFEEDGSISRGEVLAALGKGLPRSLADVQYARAKAAAAPKIEVAILWDPGTPAEEQKIWVTYLFARAAFAAKERDEIEDVTLGEREASFDEEVRARTVAVNTFRALRNQDEKLAASYFSDIDRVETAGFLREYVWRYLRHKSWMGMPPALDLRTFDEWRRTNLPNHTPVTRGRIAFKLATPS